MFARVNNDEECQSLQNDLNSLVDWSAQWQLNFNISKCKVMHIGTKNNHFTYSMGTGPHLESTRVEKDLGVHVDVEL